MVMVVLLALVVVVVLALVGEFVWTLIVVVILPIGSGLQVSMGGVSDDYNSCVHWFWKAWVKHIKFHATCFSKIKSVHMVTNVYRLFCNLSAHLKSSWQPTFAKQFHTSTCRDLWHGIKYFVSKFHSVICWGPAKQMLAPESGNMVISTGGILVAEGGIKILLHIFFLWGC